MLSNGKNQKCTGHTINRLSHFHLRFVSNNSSSYCCCRCRSSSTDSTHSILYCSNRTEKETLTRWKWSCCWCVWWLYRLLIRSSKRTGRTAFVGQKLATMTSLARSTIVCVFWYVQFPIFLNQHLCFWSTRFDSNNLSESNLCTLNFEAFVNRFYVRFEFKLFVSLFTIRM